LRAREDIAFVLVGDGAERERLVERCGSMALPNVRMLPQIPHDQIPTVWAASDAAIIILRPSPTFELVIPSKMFEAMAMRRPIILGVRGHAQKIVQDAECGLAFAPGDATELASQVGALADDPSLRQRLGDNGFRLVMSTYDRDELAHKYLAILERVVSGYSEGERAPCTR
jgi:glycosyltransferase involved in cell wall biosynthesis